MSILIVGAGISGLVLAERYANKLGEDVTIIEKRNHIGGNCYDFLDNQGILVPKYGPHFFHTNSDIVWNYLSYFTNWHPYEHKVLSLVDTELVPIPVNITTVNKIFNLNIKNEIEMSDWLDRNSEKIANPKNSEESAVSRVGIVLYEKLFKYYTKKQWDLWPHQLDAEVMNRIPVRKNFDDRYFTDKYQSMPVDGYTKMFQKMVENKKIKIFLSTSWENFKSNSTSFDKIFFTGPIDSFFDFKIGKLQYRSINFEFESLNKEFFQSATTINFSSLEVPYTRITEPKLATGQKNLNTTIIKEFPTWNGEPCYPVLTEENRKLYKKYKTISDDLLNNHVYFIGRLGRYKYLNMDQAVEEALNFFNMLNK